MPNVKCAHKGSCDSKTYLCSSTKPWVLVLVHRVLYSIRKTSVLFPNSIPVPYFIKKYISAHQNFSVIGLYSL